MKKEVRIFAIATSHEEYVAKKVKEICDRLGAEFYKEESVTYSFRELPENIQNKIIEKNRNIHVHFDWWEWTIKEWKEKLSEIGFDDAPTQIKSCIVRRELPNGVDMLGQNANRNGFKRMQLVGAGVCLTQ